MHRPRRIMKWLGVLLLAVCRTLYSWMFFIWSLSLILAVTTFIQGMERSKILDIYWIVVFIYSTVMGIAWWTIYRGKSESKYWAIASSFFFILISIIVDLLSRQWLNLLKEEIIVWLFILFGIFGIILFSIPYHGRRRRSQNQAKSAGIQNGGLRLNRARRIIKWLGALLLTICRTCYSIMCIIWTLVMFIAAVTMRIPGMTRSNIEIRVILWCIIFVIYSIISAIAWWMLYRGKAKTKQWAIVANGIIILSELTILVFQSRPNILSYELVWPIILPGIFGTIIFCIPYRERRHN